MSSKHYNINYLEDTGRFLKSLKEYSYNPFAGINEGTIIDLGCGTGMDAINLSNMLDKRVDIVGIDHDQAMLDKGTSSITDQKNVRFILSEANHIPFEAGTVAGVRAERLIQHLVEPENSINEIHRVLKKGSPVVLIETDWSGLTFYNEHILIEEKISRYLTDKKINNGIAARKLTNYLERVGFNDIRLELFPFIIKSLNEANEYLWIERMIAEAADENFISQNEKELFVAALNKANEKNYFACSINVVIVSSVK
ncbi:MAG TPA: methyltransferase domain-containing protein [Mucilaginibacter sp.]|jgi:ubiquinone/menaquinone biosynthesis C-methylase UbiE|nr:methyltransferase domain-containing protein [Mucilaginibacter sp.]